MPTGTTPVALSLGGAILGPEWYTPLPKSGKHGGPQLRLFRPGPSELGYLSWGRRFYGEPPLMPRPREGWHYFVVLEGHPSLIVGAKQVPIPAGTVSIADPDCLIGHSDKPGRSCKMLTWIWRVPPAHSALRPKKDGYLRFSLEPDQIRRLTHLHMQCRAAVADSTERSMLQLRATHLLLDLCLLDAIDNRREPNEALRFDLAIHYLHNHPSEHAILPGLCEYLQVSKASLNRLFRKHVGKSPREYAHELRMHWAREQLTDPTRSVKSVSYALGYRHLPDFSRAFRRHFGISASDVPRQGAQ